MSGNATVDVLTFLLHVFFFVLFLFLFFTTKTICSIVASSVNKARLPSSCILSVTVVILEVTETVSHRWWGKLPNRTWPRSPRYPSWMRSLIPEVTAAWEFAAGEFQTPKQRWLPVSVISRITTGTEGMQLLGSLGEFGFLTLLRYWVLPNYADVIWVTSRNDIQYGDHNTKMLTFQLIKLMR